MTLPGVETSAILLRRLAGAVLGVVIISMVATGCTTNAEWDQRLMKSGNVVLVSTDTFQNLQSGMTTAEVNSLCGGAGRFQFAVRFLNSDYLCVSYQVDTSDYTHNDEPHYVLFRDGVMWKTVDAGQEDLPASASVVECGVAAAGVMLDRGEMPEELRSRFRKASPPYPEKSTDDYNIPAWLCVAILSVQWPHMQAMVRRNQSLEDRQNGLAVRLGMTPRQVEEVVGRPRCINRKPGEQGLSSCTYGKYAGLQKEYAGGGEYEARPLIVLYLQDKAVAVFGHNFVPPPPVE